MSQHVRIANPNDPSPNVPNFAMPGDLGSGTPSASTFLNGLMQWALLPAPRAMWGSGNDGVMDITVNTSRPQGSYMIHATTLTIEAGVTLTPDPHDPILIICAQTLIMKANSRIKAWCGPAATGGAGGGGGGAGGASGRACGTVIVICQDINMDPTAEIGGGEDGSNGANAIPPSSNTNGSTGQNGQWPTGFSSGKAFGAILTNGTAPTTGSLASDHATASTGGSAWSITGLESLEGFFRDMWAHMYMGPGDPTLGQVASYRIFFTSSGGGGEGGGDSGTVGGGRAIPGTGGAAVGFRNAGKNCGDSGIIATNPNPAMGNAGTSGGGGGAGGWGGRTIVIVNRTIISGGKIRANGGAGGNGGNASGTGTGLGYGGGPGAGGEGGLIYYWGPHWTGTFDVTAGTPGLAGTGFNTTSPWTAITAGTAGTLYACQDS